MAYQLKIEVFMFPYSRFKLKVKCVENKRLASNWTFASHLMKKSNQKLFIQQSSMWIILEMEGHFLEFIELLITMVSLFLALQTHQISCGWSHL